MNFTSKFLDKLETILCDSVIFRTLTDSVLVIQENAESELRAHSSSVKRSKIPDRVPQASLPKTGKHQPFTKEEALVGIYNVCVIFSFCLLEFNYSM